MAPSAAAATAVWPSRRRSNPIPIATRMLCPRTRLVRLTTTEAAASEPAMPSSRSMSTFTGSPPTPVGAALFIASPASRIIQSRPNGTRAGEIGAEDGVPAARVAERGEGVGHQRQQHPPPHAGEALADGGEARVPEEPGDEGDADDRRERVHRASGDPHAIGSVMSKDGRIVKSTVACLGSARRRVYCPARMADRDDEDFAALLAASERTQTRERRMAAGDVVRGRVIAVGASTAFVAVGGKAEAAIDLGEFRDPATGEVRLAEGDEIEATVVDDGSRSGSIVLKRVAGRGGHVPGELEQAFAHGIAVEGLVTGENKGGFDVQIGERARLLPGLADRPAPRRAGAQYVGQRFRFRITKLEAGGRNVVVSRRQLLEEEAAAQAAATWARAPRGRRRRGHRHLDARLRRLRRSRRHRGADPRERARPRPRRRIRPRSCRSASTVEAQVVKLEPDAERRPRPRRALAARARARSVERRSRERFPVGTTVRGVVRRLEQFGAFVELAPGIDGLVHVSRMALDRRVSHPRQVGRGRRRGRGHGGRGRSGEAAHRPLDGRAARGRRRTPPSARSGATPSRCWRESERDAAASGRSAIFCSRASKPKR